MLANSIPYINFMRNLKACCTQLITPLNLFLHNIYITKINLRLLMDKNTQKSKIFGTNSVGNQKNKADEEKELFWADQLADQIINREKFDYLDKKIPKFDVFSV